LAINAIRGFNDILPGKVERWHFLEDTARDLFESFGFSEIRIPIMEKTELFVRGIGETSDIVEKEMYTFPDRHGESITLRPEGTASVVRAFIEHSIYARDPVSKLYYIGPMFRYERPQKGRYRQFHQMGAEIFGVESPFADAEVLSMLMELFRRTEIRGAELQINSLGCNECRPNYRSALLDFLKTRTERLCPDCQRRIKINPLRALDCKNEGCKEETIDAPSILDSLCLGCSTHFQEVRSNLDNLGTSYSVNPRMVRGLDYYLKTTFEIVCPSLGAQNAAAAGGRYDGLVKDLGGPDIPGLGFAIGMERAVSLMGIPDVRFLKRPMLFIATVGDQARAWALRTKYELNARGIWSEIDYEGKSIKSQMRRADKIGARFAVVIGDSEVSSGMAILKDMVEHREEKVPLSGIAERVKGC
jgi:histidyl-tRNA synthetase